MANENKRHPGRPKQTTWAPCKVSGCAKDTKSGGFGMCRTHYMQTHRGMRGEDGELLREPLRIRSYGPGALCCVAGCGNRPAIRGYCKTHVPYVQPMPEVRHAEEARVLGHCRICTEDVVYVAAGMCSKHYMQVCYGLIDIDGNKLREPRIAADYGDVPCIVEGCDSRPVSRGMCNKHALQRKAGILSERGNKLREFRKKPRGEKWVSRDGYALIPGQENHPFARVDGSVLEHRLVMEKHLGRFLQEHEIVHHIDGNRQNNDISNLELMDGRARRGVGHPPGHRVTEARAREDLEHLRINDPTAFRRLLMEMKP